MELVERMMERRDGLWGRAAAWLARALRPKPRAISEADLPDRLRRDIGLG
jgi:hypothetical protein